MQDIRSTTSNAAEASTFDEGLAGLTDEQLAKVKASAYAAADALMLTDAPLLRPPGQLALAAVRSAFNKVRGRPVESAVAPGKVVGSGACVSYATARHAG